MLLTNDAYPPVQSIKFRNFKKFSRFNLSLQRGNLLTGPNNSGKSSILDAFRLLEACLRHTKTKNPKLMDLRERGCHDGYELNDGLLPFSIANITHNYDDEDAILEFYKDAKTKAVILLNPTRLTRFYIDAGGNRFTTGSKFRGAFPLELVIIPTLSPLEPEERWVEDATVQKNKNGRLASRVLRNIWLREPDSEFASYRRDVESAWPDILLKKPEVVRGSPAIVQMYFSESRKDREVQWAGFGFQAWLQIQTHLRRATNKSLLIIDEPDVYLHPDLQRRLLSDVRGRVSQFLMATHSIELINDAEPEEIISINTKFRSGKRVRTDEDIDGVYRYLGSTANADLARISRARRVIFVEGKDGRLLRKLARRLGFEHLAEAASVPIVQLGGFSRWNRAQDAAWAFRSVLNLEVEIFCLFDRDFRCADRVASFSSEMNTTNLTCKILDGKEIENYLLDLHSIHRAVCRRLKARNQQGVAPTSERLLALCSRIASGFKTRVLSQMAADHTTYAEECGSKIDKSTLLSER
jgi:hypothetical protein